jgi:hypothetical protein
MQRSFGRLNAKWALRRLRFLLQVRVRSVFEKRHASPERMAPSQKLRIPARNAAKRPTPSDSTALSVESCGWLVQISGLNPRARV